MTCFYTSHFLLSSVIFLVSRGENSGSQTQEVMDQVKLLKAQISELEAQEKELDNQKTWLEENIKLLNHAPFTKTYLFMLSAITLRSFDFFFLFSHSDNCFLYLFSYMNCNFALAQHAQFLHSAIYHWTNNIHILSVKIFPLHLYS